MITTSMLKRQVWMADDGEFDHILENSERVLGLNAQYENHPYTEQFTKERYACARNIPARGEGRF